jgi:hypothetical protein
MRAKSRQIHASAIMNQGSYGTTKANIKVLQDPHPVRHHIL